ncbi:MAG: hypothetical protein ABH871_09165 [Pseudomonadota bacterium]
MKAKKQKILARFMRFGVLHREEVKNDLAVLKKLLRAGLVKKSRKQGRVFYELTEIALPIIEQYRRIILEELRLRALLDRGFALAAEDVRFLDEHAPEADDFMLLGDWQLAQPVVPAQLELAKLRFYSERVTPRSRRKKAA